MARQRLASAKPKAKKSAATVTTPRPRTSFLAFVGGLVAALPLTLAAAIPFINSEVSAGLASGDRTVHVRTAADNLSCAQAGVSAGGAGGAGGQVLGDSTMNTPGGGGAGGGNNQTPPPMVQHIIGGNLTANGSITGPTGPDSNNYVTNNLSETVTVTNNNNLNVSNSSSQSASSGSAEVEHNTSGGSASSGDAWNANSTNLNFVVSN